MYEKAFRLQIITPARIVFQGEASSLSVPGVLGGFQVLAGHAPLLSTLDIGRLKVKDLSGSDTIYAAGSGFVEVSRNDVTVLVESAERADEIDIQRAKAARERAEQRLRSRDAAVDTVRAKLALLRAQNRLRVSGTL